MSVTVDTRSRNRLVFGVLCAASGAVVTLAVVASVTGLPHTFAGWTAVPAFSTGAPELRPALRQCEAPASGGRTEHLGRLAISETRGQYVAAVYTGSDRVPSNSSVCLVRPGHASSRPAASWCSSSSLALDPIPAGQIETTVLQTCDLSGRNGIGEVTIARGRVGRGITTVTIGYGHEGVTGTDVVQATVADGWYLAWWPGTSSGAVAVFRGASGKGAWTPLN